jgi:hypothetical protein
MSAGLSKEREFWLKLIVWLQEEARGEHQQWEGSSPVWPFQAQRWLTSWNPLISKQFFLVCELAGIEKQEAEGLQKDMRSLYGVVGGQGWAIAKRQDRGKKCLSIKKT